MPRLLLPISLLFLSPALLFAADWPHWLGPKRDGSAPETGVLDELPKGGPKVLWKVQGGAGNSAVSVAGGRAVTQVRRGDEELVLALDAATGKELWTAKIAPGHKGGAGPGATPTLEGDFVYAQSAAGRVVCLEAATGQEVWGSDILKEFAGANHPGGLAAAPLVEGDLLIVLPGGKGASVAALDNRTGEVVWKAGNNGAANVSPLPLTVGGKRQVAYHTAAGLSGIEAGTGQELWKLAAKTAPNAATPILVGDKLFAFAGAGGRGSLFRFNARGAAEEEWAAPGPKNLPLTRGANVVAFEGYLYGIVGQTDDALALTCVDLATGGRMWSEPGFPRGWLTLANGHLWIVTSGGELILVHANPKGFQECGRARVLGANDTPAAIAERRLYLRDREFIYCLDIRS